MRLNPIAVAAAATLALSPLPALADSPRNSITVYHNDLNLADAAGRSTLDRRILAAAKIVCRVDDSKGPLAIEMLGRRCMRTSIANARPAVDVAVSRAASAPVNVAAAGAQ